jgi:hypothetical protein
MIDLYQRKALQKIINSDIIKDIYPVIDNIEVHYFETPSNFFTDELRLNIYLNDPEANKINLYDKFQFDYHWLIDHHIRKLLPYFSIDNDNTAIRYRIYDTNFDIIEKNY